MHSRLPLPTMKTARDRAALAAFCGCMFVAVTCLALTAVRISDVSTAFDGHDTETSLPAKFPSDQTGVRTVSFHLSVSPFHPRGFYVGVDDCLESLEINGQDVKDEALPFCDFSRGRTLDLDDYLRTGTNEVRATVRNDGGDGMFDLRPSTRDPAFLFPLVLFAAGIAAYATYLLRRRNAQPWAFGVLGTLLTGTFVRILYFLGTPYWVRGHDTDGHIEYVRYLLDHFRIPKVGEGWESWQPPLYYALVAVPSGIAGMFGADAMAQARVMQLCALVASLACLWIGYVVGKEALDKDERRQTLWIFAGTIAVAPSLVYFSARINNDVLTALLGFAAVAFLLRWWRAGRTRDWMLLSVTIALSILTKNTNLLLIPIAGICLLLRRGTTWKQTFRSAGIGIAAVLIIAAWLPAYRSLTNGEQGLVGNVGNLHSGLLLKNEPSSYLTFNPLKVVSIPYNDPWNDDGRRQQFPEYLYKSAFFGEFHFGDERKTFASAILLLSFVPLALSLFGMAWSLRHRAYASIPHFAVLAVLLAGHAAFRFRYPYSSSQDFRYSVVVLLPFAYFLCVGIGHLKPLALRRLASILTGVFLLACTIFLANLS